MTCLGRAPIWIDLDEKMKKKLREQIKYVINKCQ